VECPPPSGRTPPPDWLARVDFVLAEDRWYDRKAQCSHPDWKDGMGPRCFLWQQGHRNDSVHVYWKRKNRWNPIGGKGMKWLYQCIDYKPDGPLSLPPLEKRKPR